MEGRPPAGSLDKVALTKYIVAVEPIARQFAVRFMVDFSQTLRAFCVASLGAQQKLLQR